MQGMDFILDDFGFAALTDRERSDLLEVS